jgi:hypothetical protein
LTPIGGSSRIKESNDWVAAMLSAGARSCGRATAARVKRTMRRGRGQRNEVR